MSIQTSTSLQGKTIVLGVSGSIAAVRCVELIRQLKRHGAEVHVVITKEAQKIIHPYALQYASKNSVITEITGNVEHVEFCGIGGKANLLLIAPATANTIGKIANGIDDTPLTTFATTAFSSNIPIIIVPAMHESMYAHPIVIENLKKLSSLGIEIINPIIEEGAAKIASNSEIVFRVESALTKKTLKGKRILITSGATSEAIDPIRILTNRSSGKTGIELSLEALRRGALVSLVHKGFLGMSGICEFNIESANDMKEVVIKELENGYDLMISAAAISDFTIEKAKDKIKSGNEITLKLIPAPKLIKEVRAKYPELKIIGFKAETGLSQEELIKNGRILMDSSNLSMVIANDVTTSGIGSDENNIYILSKNEEVLNVSGTKRKLASIIMDKVEKII